MNQLNHENLVAIDLETSGINPFKHDVLSIALVPIDEKLPPKTLYIRHNSIEWSSFAYSNFLRFSSTWEENCIDPNQACEEIENYLRRTFHGNIATPIGHNIGFDVAFLRRLAFQAGRDQLAGLSHRALDTHTMLFVLNYQKKIPKEALSSDGAFSYFNIDIQEKHRHTAIGDAEATRTLFKLMLNNLKE